MFTKEELGILKAIVEGTAVECEMLFGGKDISSEIMEYVGCLNKIYDKLNTLIESGGKITNFAINYTKERLLNKILQYWNTTVYVHNGLGVKNVQTYRDWLDQCIDKNAIPEELSYCEVISFLKNELMSKYDEEVELALENSALRY